MKRFLILNAIAISLGFLVVVTASAEISFNGDIFTNNYSVIYVGDVVGGASCMINGGSTLTNSAYLGYQATSIGNTMSISGVGSAVLGSVAFGNGSSNQLTISHGAEITGSVAIGNVNLDYGVPVGNSVLVTDPGTYVAGGILLEAETNSPATVSILNGATVNGGSFVLGNNCAITISGAGTILDMNGGNGFDIDLGNSNTISVANAASVIDGSFYCFGSSSNLITVSGQGTTWSGSGYPNYFALGGNRNTFAVSSGGQLAIPSPVFVGAGGGFRNSMIVTDAGSLLSINGLSPGGTQSFLSVGMGDTNCSLVVTNGSKVTLDGRMYIDDSAGSAAGVSNQVVVSGSGSSLDCGTNTILLEASSGFGSGNELSVQGGGQVRAGNLYIGRPRISSGFLLNNNTTVAGLLTITNGGGTGLISVYGSNALTCTGGTIIADNLICDLGGNRSGPTEAGRFNLSSGTVKLASAGITNGLPVVIGDGTDTANYIMRGGTHSFNNGVVISNNSILSGCGTINGSVTNYGTINLNNGCDMYFNGLVVNYGKIISAANATPHFLGGLMDHTATRSFPILTSDGGFGITAGQFTFTVAWNSGKVVVVQSSSDLRNWIPVETNTITTPYFQAIIPATTGSGGTFFRAKALP